MFGSKSFLVKIILVWSLLSIILVQGKRQKKDVRHMILLNDGAKLPKMFRHKSHSHGKESKTKRKHKNNNKAKYESFSSSEESSEEYSREVRKPKRQQSKRKHHHKRYKDQNKQESHKYHSYQDNRIQPESYQFSEGGKWKPMTSHELYGRTESYSNAVFPGGYHSGSIHFGQPVPIEITTPFSMPSNSFISYESTLYPPLNPMFNANSYSLSSGHNYKPYDYSVLNQKPQPSNFQGSDAGGTIDSHLAESAVGTPFSIIVENSAEKTDKEKKVASIIENPSNGNKIKGKRGRGGSRFKFGQRTLS